MKRTSQDPAPCDPRAESLLLGRLKRLAQELESALAVLSSYDEGPDLVLYYKHLMVLEGNPEYAHQLNADDQLSASQRAQLESQWQQFRSWWNSWPGTAA